MNHSEQLFWLKQAYFIATLGPDPSTQNAALLINDHVSCCMLFAVNDFPAGIDYSDERLTSPLKYNYVEHAERNVIYEAAYQGVSTYDLTMVCPWAACPDCARAIIISGIRELVTHQQALDDTPERWWPAVEIGIDMLREAGVVVTIYDGAVGGPQIRRNGRMWQP